MSDLSKKIDEEFHKSINLRKITGPSATFKRQYNTEYVEMKKLRKKQDEHYKKWLFYKNLNKEFNKGEEK